MTALLQAIFSVEGFASTIAEIANCCLQAVPIENRQCGRWATISRHTAATWLMQRGVPVWEAAGFLGMSAEVLLAI